LKVLIIDDDPVTRQVLSKFLAERSFIPQTAANGKEALQLLKAQKDIARILLDISMPEMNAYEMMIAIQADEQLSAMPYEIHIISDTDKESILAEMHARNINMSCVRNILKKPVDMEIMAFALSI
jgi:CheY-like chemotaxis protein